MRVDPQPGRPQRGGPLPASVLRRRMLRRDADTSRRARARREHGLAAKDIARRTGLPVADVLEALAEGRSALELLEGAGVVGRLDWRSRRFADLLAWRQCADPHGARLG